MRPRLVAAREVLRATGAIFVSIDDHEVAHLRLLLDEVYGERNFLAQVVVNLNPKGRQLGGGFATSHEYLLVYARDAAPVRARRDARTETVDPRDFPLTAAGRPPLPAPAAAQHQQEVQPGDRAHPALPGVGRPGDRAGRDHPVRRARSRCCRSSATGRRPSGAGRGRGSTSGPTTWCAGRSPAGWGSGSTSSSGTGSRADGAARSCAPSGSPRRSGSTDTAVAELKELVGHVFESPKPTGLLRRILHTMPDDAVVLDFFAGSGTTGHAVALANAEDGGTRTCLSVNSAEPTRPGSNAHARRPADRRRHHPRPAPRRRRHRRRRLRERTPASRSCTG